MARTGDQKSARRHAARTVYGRSCARCGFPILPGQRWDLDHVDVPYVDGGYGRRAPSHESCNRRAGQRLMMARRAARRRQETAGMKWTAAGIEVSADRSRTWVALAGVATLTKRVVISLEDPLPGAAVVPQIVALWQRHGLDWLGIDPRSASATLVEPLRAQGMPLRLADTAGVAKAHGNFADMLAGDRLRVRGHSALDAAVRAAQAPRVAGGTAVDRFAGAEVAPLMAAELSVLALGDPEDAGGIEPGAWVI